MKLRQADLKSISIQYCPIGNHLTANQGFVFFLSLFFEQSDYNQTQKVDNNNY